MYNSIFKNREVQAHANVSLQDLINVRKDIIGEFDAINQYEMHAMNTDNKMIKDTLSDIKKEEEIHVGELMALLFTLDNEAKTQFEKGVQEFNNKFTN